MKPAREWEEDDLIGLIETGVTEDLRLEFKASPALDKNKKDEISKDVSAFANAAGGTIVYGIVEHPRTREATEIDDGLDPAITRIEWLEQVIDSNIQRRIEGLTVKAIALTKRRPGRVAYLVSIPESRQAPHMASDKRFHKRLGTTTARMEEYEVRTSYRKATYPSKEIACAWRDTVINPLLNSLENEEEVLERPTRTWDYRKRIFKELVLLTEEPLRQTANREDFLDKYEQVSAKLFLHDQALKALNQTCRTFFSEIKPSSWLAERYDAAISSEALEQLRARNKRLQNFSSHEAILAEFFGELSTREDHLAQLAENTINNLEELDIYSRSSAPFWNMHRERFVELLHPRSPLATPWNNVLIARGKFLGSIAELRNELKTIRSELSVTHGIAVEDVPKFNPYRSGGLLGI